MRKRKQIHIDVRGQMELANCHGERLGLAVTKYHDTSEYAVTHVRSGLGLAWFKSPSQAGKAMKAIAGVVDWGGTQKQIKRGPRWRRIRVACALIRLGGRINAHQISGLRESAKRLGIEAPELDR